MWTVADDDPPIESVFRQPFAQQVAFFRQKLGNLVPTRRWDDIWQEAHDSAFMVAGAAKADLLADLAGSVDQAISQGQTLEGFREAFRGIIEKHGWAGFTGDDRTRERPKGGNGLAWRTKVIYETNLITSYSAGRLAQLREAGYPWWIYKHSDFVRRPRRAHVALDGITKAADDPFWRTYYPPNGWGCRCRVVGARGPASIERLGGSQDKPLPDWVGQVDPKTGAPVGIDRGFAYQPGARVADTVRALAGKIPNLPADIGAALGQYLPLEKLKADFGQFFDEATADLARPKGQSMVVGAMKPSWVKAMRDGGVGPATAEIMVRDKDIAHMFRDAKVNPMDPAWFRGLPEHLRKPQAVLIDRTQNHNSLLLVYDDGKTANKLVLRVDYRLKGKGPVNLIGTGMKVSKEELKRLHGSIGHGYTLIDGDL